MELQEKFKKIVMSNGVTPYYDNNQALCIDFIPVEEAVNQCTKLCLEEQISILNWVISMSSPTVTVKDNTIEHFIKMSESLQQQLKSLEDENME